MEAEDGDSPAEMALRWLRSLANGSVEGYEFEVRAAKGLQILEVRKGFIRCSFLVSNLVLDKEGNWDRGAMATLMDHIGATTACTLNAIKASTEFSISYISTAKINEEAEIEAKAVGEKGNMTLVMVKVRSKATKGLIALGKLWLGPSLRAPTSKL
ncbi:hypothetical protein RJ641_024142 [Dillenia turbinata]|uniref:Thioesterase domain-containing protein n=1 Tax=Dillenia turbinata TaxID=194707 RepID=A0AAN8UFW8_9MAGN